MTKIEAYKLLMDIKYEKTSKTKLQFFWISILYWTGKYENAIDYMDKLSSENMDMEVCSWKGVIYYFLQDYTKACYFLEKAEKINPKSIEIKYLLAETFYIRSQIEKAKAKYRILTGNQAYKASGLYGIGCCLLKVNRHDEALSFLNKASTLAKRGELVKILNNKGLCLMNLGKLVEAQQCFEKCLQISPNDITIRMNQALVLSKLEDYEKAGEIYKNILLKIPYNIMAINNYASCIAAKGDYEEALKYCDIGLQIDSLNPDLLINKGYCLYKLEYYHNAIECLKEAEKIVKDDIILLNNKALCLVALRKYDDALKIFEWILAKSYSDELMFNKAYCLVKKGIYSEALECLTRITDKDNKKFDIYNLKGICYEQLGNYEAAVENFNKSLTIAG